MIAIIGGGICGLSIGWRLAQAGRDVTVFERAQAGRGATWAAGGVLAASTESEPAEESLLPLLQESLAMWPDFARELESAAGISVDMRTEGLLHVALDRDEAENLQFHFDFQKRQGLATEWLDGAQVRELEPHLSPRVCAAILSRSDYQVDNRKVALALIEAFQKAGGTLREGAEVSDIVTGNGRVTGVRAGGETVAADTVVLAAGAHSRGVGGIPENLRPPVRPVKGQMLSLQMDADAPLLRHVLLGPAGYLVPRNSGALLAGTTVEEQSFDMSLTAGGIYEILRRAREVLPGVHDLPIIEMWAGLRPGSRDDAPLLGPCAIPGLVMATGHHRNGILLAPVTARVIADYLLTGAWRNDLGAFAADRFAA